MRSRGSAVTRTARRIKRRREPQTNSRCQASGCRQRPEKKRKKKKLSFAWYEILMGLDVLWPSLVIPVGFKTALEREARLQMGWIPSVGCIGLPRDKVNLSGTVGPADRYVRRFHLRNKTISAPSSLSPSPCVHHAAFKSYRAEKQLRAHHVYVLKRNKLHFKFIRGFIVQH